MGKVLSDVNKNTINQWVEQNNPKIERPIILLVIKNLDVINNN